MKFDGNVTIVLEGVKIDQRTLDGDRRHWCGKALFPLMTPQNVPDATLFRGLLYEATPVTIHAAKGGKLVLSAEFKRFNAKGYETYGLRLAPIAGEVARVEMNHEPTIAYQNLQLGADLMSADMGMGMLRLEIYMRQTEHLPSLRQPAPFSF